MKTRTQKSDRREAHTDRVAQYVHAAADLRNCIEFKSIEKFFDSDHDIRRILSDEGYEARMFSRIVEAPELIPELYFIASDLLDVMFEQESDRRTRLVEKATAKMMAKRQESASTTRLDRLVLASIGSRLPDAVARWTQCG